MGMKLRSEEEVREVAGRSESGMKKCGMT